MIDVYALVSCLLVSVYLWVCWCVVCYYNVLWMCSVVICKSYHVRDNSCIWQQNISRAHYNNTPHTNKPTNKHSPTNKTLMHKHLSLQSSTLTDSHQLLMMNVIAFETCWAIKNFHKVTSSWLNLFNLMLYLENIRYMRCRYNFVIYSSVTSVEWRSCYF